MEQIRCPIDGQPCAQDCPDRYTDCEEGGCVLTTAQELGVTVFIIGSDGGFL